MRDVRIIEVILTSLLSVSPLSGFAQNQIGQVPPVSLIISSRDISSLAIDSDGFFWMGTNHGLNRFNGNSFRPYLSLDSLSMANDVVRSLYADQSNNLWVGTETGIQLIRNNRVVRSVNKGYFPVNCIVPYDGNHLLFSDPQGISIYNISTGEAQPLLSDSDYAFSTSLLKTSGSYFWIPAQPRLCSVGVFDNSFSLVRKLPLPNGGNLHSLTEFGGKVYLCASSGFYSFLPDGTGLETISRHPTFFALPYGEDLLVGVQGKGFLPFLPDRGFSLPLGDERLQEAAACIACISDDRIIYSVNHDGFKTLFLDSEGFVRTPDPSSTGTFIAAKSIDRSRILAVSRNRFYIIDGKDLKDITPSKERTYFRNCIFMEEGTIWTAADDGTVSCYSFDGEALKIKFSRSFATPTSPIWRHSDGSVRTVSGTEIYSLGPDGRVKELASIPHSYDFWSSTSLSTGEAILLDKDSMFLLDRDMKLSRLPVSFLNPNQVLDNEDGSFWVSTLNDGVFLIDRQGTVMKHLSSKEGLPDNNCKGLFLDSQGSLWLTTRGAITKISTDTYRNVSYNFGNRSGFRPGPVSICEGSGNILFLLGNGIYLFDKDRMGRKDAPQMILDGVWVNNMFRSFGEESLQLDYDQNNVTFYYSVVGHSGDEVTYMCLLDGMDKDWVNMGLQQRQGYSNLPPGRYVFKLATALPDGELSRVVDLFSFRIKPAPWKSPLAYILYSLAALLVAGALEFFVRRHRKYTKQLERAELKRKMEEQLSRSKMEFFTEISHEYRTPLSLIYGPAKQLAAEADIPDNARSLLALVETNADRLLKLTGQLLDFERIQASGVTLQVRKGNLSSHLHSLVEEFRYLPSQKGLALECDILDGVTGFFDSDKLDKILFNLLSNAVKYTETGKVSIRFNLIPAEFACRLYPGLQKGYDGSYAEVSVSDTGIGIPEEGIRKIFSMFERLEVKIEGGGRPEGFGIGLPYALVLTHLHKGEMTVDSKVGTGSVFTFVIPLEDTAYSKDEVWESPIEPSSDAIPYQATGPVAAAQPEDIVLVVDDNADMRNYLNSLLCDTYKVVCANDGEEASETLRILMPDVIISDVMMPGKDGYELCREIKNDDKLCHLPVILLTAKTGMATQMDSLSSGADAYVPKPFDPKYLKSTILNLLENRRRIRSRLSLVTSTSVLSDDEGINPRDVRMLKKIYSFLDEHLGEEDFNVQSLAAEIGMSRSSLHSKLKTLTGYTPQEFLTSYRLNKAMELLRRGDMNVSEVSYEVGYTSLAGFSRSFKNKFGVSPSSVTMEKDAVLREDEPIR